MANSDAVACILVVLAVVVALWLHSAAASLPEVVPEIHRVQPGDTYWSIARQYWPREHTGERVFMLRELNDIRPDALQPGDVVYLREVE